MSQHYITEQNVIDEVIKAIVETLGIDANSVHADISLVRDLGAESLDFLDINYRLEQTFGIKMARHSILEHIEEAFGEDSAIDENGQLTDQAVSLLKVRFGDPQTQLSPGMDMDEVPVIITVQSIAKGVMDILDSLPEKCPACGHPGWAAVDSQRINCGACGAAATFANGDDLVKAWLSKVQAEQKIF
jgi:acyl carrier protein